MSSMLLAAAAAALNPAATPVPAPPQAPTPAAASGPTITAEQALENARALTTAVRPRAPECPETSGDEIVVCVEHEDPKKQYVPSDTDSGLPDDGGIPRAPNVSTLPTGGMRIGKTPRHPKIIDLSAIPEPPAGSDADLIAKGEKAPP